MVKNLSVCPADFLYYKEPPKGRLRATKSMKVSQQKGTVYERLPCAKGAVTAKRSDCD